MNTSNLFTLDTAIVAAYLLITLVIGLRAGRGITTMQDYVIGTSGTQRYGVPVLVGTLFATIIGGGSTIGLSEKVFTLGLIWFCVALGEALLQFLVAFYIAPHLGRFEEKLSVGEMMGSFYGKPAHVVTGIAGTIRCVGDVGAQIVAMGYLFHYFLGLPQLWGVLISCGIVAFYASFGGIRSVTATDIFQFAVLVIIIPIIAGKMLNHAGGLDAIRNGVPLGHFEILSQNDFWHYVFVFLVLAFPRLDPAYMQRLLMTRGDIKAAFDALIAAGWLRIVLTCLITLIAFAVVVLQPNLEPRHALLHAVSEILGPGFRGVGIAGLFAIIMSTADSQLHGAGISLVHDTIQPLRSTHLADDKALKLTRIITFLLGISAVVAAVSFENIWDLILASLIFWFPVIVVPLLAGIVGYFSSTRSFIFAAVTGGMTAIGWQLVGLAQTTGVGAALPGLAANLIAFVIARQFDHPGNIYYDPDDALAQMAKEKMTKRANKGQAEAKKKIKASQRAAHIMRACIVSPLMGLFAFLWTKLTTSEWLHSFCRLREQRYGINTWGLVFFSILALGLTGFIEPTVGGGFGQTLLGLRVFAGCLWLFLGFQELFTWSLLRQNTATCCFGAMMITWPFISTFALFAHNGHLIPFSMWALALLLPVLMWDAAAGFWMGILGVFPGYGLYRLLGGTNTGDGVLKALPVEGLIFALFAVTGIALLARGREMAACIQLALLKMKQAFTAHEAKKPLVDGRNGGKKLKEHMSDLIAAHREKAAKDPASAKTEAEYRELEKMPEYLEGACQDGVDFMNELIQEGKDPVGHEPQPSIISIAVCVEIARRYADLGVEMMEKVHVGIKKPFFVWGNELEVAHMIRNAIKNSMRHTQKDEIIKLWGRVLLQENQLIVQDFGSGILARFVLWIMSVFYTQSADGTGVGLGMCHRTMKRMKGWITVKSIFGIGTMIIFHFPKAPADKVQKHQDQLKNKEQKQKETAEKELQELQEQLTRARAQLSQIPPRLQKQAQEHIRELVRKIRAAGG